MKLSALGRNVFVKPAPPPPHGGIYLGWGSDGPVIARPDEHLLVIGPPRSGKTTRLLAFSVLSHPGAVVVTSTKPDIIGLTSWARERLGRVWFWAPSGTMDVPEGMEELRWSPVVGCSDFDEAVARAYALSSAARPGQSVHDAHWTERAQALLAPLLHAAALEGGDVSSVLSWLHRHQLLAPITVLKDSGSERAAELLEGIARTEARERSGIFSTAGSMLSAYRTNAALRAASAPNFDPAAFAPSADTIYLCAPSTAQALHAPLVVALLDQIRSAIYKAHPRASGAVCVRRISPDSPTARPRLGGSGRGKSGPRFDRLPPGSVPGPGSLGDARRGLFHDLYPQGGPARRRRPPHAEGDIYSRRRRRRERELGHSHPRPTSADQHHLVAQAPAAAPG